MRESVLNRVPGLILSLLVVAVIAALLEGYGIPVGVGALAGFVLGGIAGLLSALWVARGAGRSVTVGSMSWSGSGNRGEPAERDLEELRSMSELSEIDLGRVVVVQPVIATQAAAGLTVGLVTAVVHEAGLRLDVEVRPQPGISEPGHLARITVRDGLGTRYRAAGQGTGGFRPARYDVRIIPRPPETVASLTVQIESFVDPFPAGSRRAEGPWTFRVPL